MHKRKYNFDNEGMGWTLLLVTMQVVMRGWVLRSAWKKKIGVIITIQLPGVEETKRR